MNGIKIAIRVDGGPGIGLGHLKRCCLIAEQLISLSAEVMFFTQPLPGIIQQLAGYTWCPVSPVENSRDYQEWQRTYKISAWLFDHYHIPSTFINQLARTCPVFVIDDGQRKSDLTCTALINGNIYADEKDYKIQGNLLVGPRYCLLNPTFCQLPPARKTRILVTMGGADPLNLTLPVVQAIRRLYPGLPVDVVVGPCFNNKDQLITQLRTFVTGEIFVGPESLVEPISRAAIVISAGGSTCYEVLASGRRLLTVTQANNQMPVVEALRRKGLVFAVDNGSGILSVDLLNKYLGQLLTDTILLERIRAEGQRLFDGKGSQRVAQAIIAKVGEWHVENC